MVGKEQKADSFHLFVMLDLFLLFSFITSTLTLLLKIHYVPEKKYENTSKSQYIDEIFIPNPAELKITVK